MSERWRQKMVVVFAVVVIMYSICRPFIVYACFPLVVYVDHQYQYHRYVPYCTCGISYLYNTTGVQQIIEVIS